MHELVVTAPFGDYARGDVITEADAMAAALNTNPASVVKCVPAAAPDAPEA